MIDRRHLLAAFPMLWMAARAGALPANPRNLIDAPGFLTTPFALGVAAGDPDADGFVAWTRIVPEPAQPDGGMVAAPVRVGWEVARDPDFRQIVRHGEAIAHPELAHAVHVEVTGLEPARPYWYRFTCGGHRSPVGRGATLPLPQARLDRLRFAVAGCQNYEEGLYTAWRKIAEEPVDFVFHYGDYIYEGPDRGPAPRRIAGRAVTPIRRHTGGEIQSITDYRLRYGLYKSDADLQAAHAAAPWFVSFDDHEVDNNWAGDHDQDGTPPELFLMRRAMAMQAYYEHMPLRPRSMPVGAQMRMYRDARFGDLMQGFFLDTRQYRSDQAYGDDDVVQGPDVYSPDRTMMGDAQESWLFDGLTRSTARWNLVAQQVRLMNMHYTKPGKDVPIASMDQWSGYMYSQRRLLSHIADHCPGNVMTVSGDAHRHYAGDLVHDQRGGIVSSEFLATSITSGADGVGDEDDFTRSAKAHTPELMAMTDRRGYVLCDVGRDTFRGDLKILDTVAVPDGRLSTYASFVSERGKPGLHRV
ncbi:alkaline phosphatase D family protein [Sphingomonas sp. S6]|jgi:alkaline phosphatase D|uniref:alkaline phosphatase D family protein n=1 Tax=Sphingomonas sp. S6 TaxID=3368600 RepID=UPI0028E85EE7|nr:alkaline phosphatase D family protein [uncultured Sphingomonas sp.]